MNNLLQSANQQQSVKLLQQPGSSALQVQQQQLIKQPTLITPAMFQTSNAEDKTIVNQQPLAPFVNRLEPLTQNQLIQALNYLLENDDEFVHKIHEAYVKSFNKMITL